MSNTIESGIPISDATRERIRALRLWHWKEVINLRKKQDRFEWRANECRDAHSKAIHNKLAADSKNGANFHLGAVQALNEFFPLGDYADNDLSKELR